MENFIKNIYIKHNKSPNESLYPMPPFLFLDDMEKASMVSIIIEKGNAIL